MPAVRTFSFFAGTAVFINFLLQVQMFTLSFIIITSYTSTDNSVCCCVEFGLQEDCQ